MATQLTLNDGSLNSAGALAIKTNGTTQAINITTGQQVEFNDGSASAPSITNTGDGNTGVFFPDADTVGITTGGTERARVDSSGNLGVGTTSPSSKLQVQGLIRTSSSASGIQIDRRDTSVSAYTLYSSAGNLQFYNGTSDVMTLDASGQLLLGQTSQTSDGQLSITTTGSNNSLITTPWADTKYLTKMYFSSSYFLGMMGNATARELRLVSNSGDANAKITFYTGAAGTASEVARIDSSGNLQVSNLAGTGNRAVYSTSTGILTNSSSDRTLKTDDQPLEQGLDSVLAMRPVNFKWIDEERMGSQREIGFIAQEMQELVPEVVGENHDETLSIDYPKLTAVLVKAVQELSAKVAALEAK